MDVRSGRPKQGEELLRDESYRIQDRGDTLLVKLK